MKKPIVLGAALAATATIAQTGHADQKVETPVTEAPQAQTVEAPTATTTATNQVTQTQVDEAQKAVDTTTQSVTSQETTVTQAKDSVSTAEQSVAQASEKVAQIEKAAENATPEGIAKATENIKAKETTVTNLEKELDSNKAKVQDAQTAETKAKETVNAAHAKVNQEESKLTDVKANVATAEQSLAEANPAAAQKAVDNADKEVKRLEAKEKAAQTDLTRATKADETRQAAIDKAKTTLDKERTDRNIPGLESALDQAKAVVKEKETTLTQLKNQDATAQTELNRAEQALADAKAAYETALAKFKQDQKLRQIIIPKDYAQHDINDVAWFQNNKDRFLDAQPKNDASDYDMKAIGSNADKVDLTNMTEAQRREIAEFTVQMMNDIQSQYWAHRDPSKTLSTIKLTDEAQALAKKVTDDYSAYYATNGGTPDKFNFAKNWGHQYNILNKYNVGESLGGLLPTWHQENRGGYTMMTLKQDIADNIRKMMLEDTGSANGHAKHLIDPNAKGAGTGVGVSTGSVNIIKIPKHILNTAPLSSTYKNTDQDAQQALKDNTGIERAEKAVTKAQAKKAQTTTAVKTGEKAVTDAQKAQETAQTKLNAANNAIAKAQKAYDDAVAVKKQVPEAQAFLKDVQNELATAKITLTSVQSTLANLEKVRTERQAVVKEAKTKLIAQKEVLKQTLQNAIKAENDLKEKGQLTKEASATVEQTKASIDTAKQAVTDAKEYLEILKNAPAKLAEAKAALDEAKAALNEAKATLEAEIAKLDALKRDNEAALKDFRKVFEAYQKLLYAKRVEESLREAQARLENEANATTQAESQATTLVHTRTISQNPTTEQSASTSHNAPKARVLPETGEQTNQTSLVGAALLTLVSAFGLTKLKRKEK